MDVKKPIQKFWVAFLSSVEMSLRFVARFPRSLTTRLSMSIRTFSTEGSFKKKENAQEASYFSKQEAEQLAKLALKAAEAGKSEEAKTAEKSALNKILAKHGVQATEALVTDLKNWKLL